MAREPVILNIYDLSTWNWWLYYLGFGGIFHSGVEVYGVEFAYGGHDYDVSGIFATNPRDAPEPVIFRESVVIGETSLSSEEVNQVVAEMGLEFKGSAYHLLQRNCNHFSDAIIARLCGRHPPSWVNRLAYMAVCLHCLLPTSWVPPLTPPTAADLLPDDERRNLLTSSNASMVLEKNAMTPAR